MTRTKIIASLNAYRGEALDVEILEAVVPLALAEPAGDDLDAALFGLFERFPDEDGHGVYWSILHGLEARGSYEAGLLASWQRRPSPFARSMLRRLSNTGRTSVGGSSLQELVGVLEDGGQ